MRLAETQPIKSTHNLRAAREECSPHTSRSALGWTGRCSLLILQVCVGEKTKSRRGELSRFYAIPELRRGRPIFFSLEINYGRSRLWSVGRRGSGGHIAKASPGITPWGALEPLTQPTLPPLPPPPRSFGAEKGA